MKKIAVTGGIASGKSTFCKLIIEAGHPLIDCDALVHEGYLPGGLLHAAVTEAFGVTIVNEEGFIDRKVLGQIVFGNSAELERLNAITHPLVRDMINHQVDALAEKGFSFVFIDIPLLFEGGLEKDYDASILIAAPEIIQIERIRVRDGLSEEEAIKRIQAQLPLEIKIKKATYVIRNEGTLETFIDEAKRLLKKIENE